MTYIMRELSLNRQTYAALLIDEGNFISHMNPGAIPLVSAAEAQSNTKLSAALPTSGKAMALSVWTWQVRPGGDWDHKVEISKYEDWAPQKGGGWEIAEGQRVAMDVWANVHYGFLGRDLGFTPDELLWGAGAGQGLHGAYKWAKSAVESRFKEFDTSYFDAVGAGDVGLHTYFDLPGDSLKIMCGMWLYETYG